MLSKYHSLRYKLQEYYGNRPALQKYLTELSKYETINGDFNDIDTSNDYQIMETMSDGRYLLRVVFYGYERWRVIFTEEGLNETFINKRFGYSGVYAFRPCERRMGYDEDQRLYNLELPLIDKTDLFPYIDFSKLTKVNAMSLIITFLGKKENKQRQYALELMIKQGKYRLAERFIINPHGDIRKALKFNSGLLKQPSDNALSLAYILGETKYQRGMLSYMDDFYSKPDFTKLLQYTSFKKFHKYCKEQLETGKSSFIARSNNTFLRDYLDYRELNVEFGLPDYPKNLYKAKDVIRDRQELKKLKKNSKKVKARAVELQAIENDNFLVMPPRSVEDFVNEGKALHHCIAQYVSNYANKKCDIYFVRRKENPEEPFVTVEIKNGEIAQMRGQYNQTSMITPEIRELVGALQ
jgi:hypothetical protein